MERTGKRRTRLIIVLAILLPIIEINQLVR